MILNQVQNQDMAKTISEVNQRTHCFILFQKRVQVNFKIINISQIAKFILFLTWKLMNSFIFRRNTTKIPFVIVLHLKLYCVTYANGSKNVTNNEKSNSVIYLYM